MDVHELSIIVVRPDLDEAVIKFVTLFSQCSPLLVEKMGLFFALPRRARFYVVC